MRTAQFVLDMECAEVPVVNAILDTQVSPSQAQELMQELIRARQFVTSPATMAIVRCPAFAGVSMAGVATTAMSHSDAATQITSAMNSSATTESAISLVGSLSVEIQTARQTALAQHPCWKLIPVNKLVAFQRVVPCA